MIQSYLTGDEYGYDQINVGSDEFSQFFKTLDSNNINDIDTIRNREVRLFNKMSNTMENPTISSKPLLSDPGHNYQGFEKYYEKKIPHKKMTYIDSYPQILKDAYKESMADVKKPVSNIHNLENEIMELDKKNNMLVIFIFFLLIVIITQYSKKNDDSVKFIIIPENQVKQKQN